jgi:hypothetical protein
MEYTRTLQLFFSIFAAVSSVFGPYDAKAAEISHAAFQSAALECAALLMNKNTKLFYKNSTPPREIQGSKAVFQVKYNDTKLGKNYTLAVAKITVGAPYPNSYSCGGIGSAAPDWSTFKRKVFLSLKPELQALGFTQLDYSKETILFANCNSKRPDSLVSFTAKSEFPIAFAGKHFKGVQGLCSKHKTLK